MNLEEAAAIVRPHAEKIAAEARADRYHAALVDIAEGRVPNAILDECGQCNTKEEAQRLFRERFLIWAQQRARAALGEPK